MYVLLAVSSHWEGMIEVNKLCVCIAPVGLTGLVGFTLGVKYKKAWLGLSGPGLCFEATFCRERFLFFRCNDCTCCPTDIIVAAVFREKVFYCRLF